MADERWTVDGVEYSVIAEESDGGGDYEWAQVALVRRVVDGHLFLAVDNGCSCNGPWEGAQELEPVATWQEAVDKLKADQPYLFTDDDVAAFAQQLMTLRPEPTR